MQNIVDIGSLITQGKILKTADIDPANDYAILQKWRPGNRKRGSDIGAYESFAIPLSELLGGGSTYTASNGLTESASDIKLGGSLTQNTAINGNYNLYFGDDVRLNTIEFYTSSSIYLSVSDGIDQTTVSLDKDRLQVTGIAYVTDRIGIGTPVPAFDLDITKSAATVTANIQNTLSTGYSYFEVLGDDNVNYISLNSFNTAGGLGGLLANNTSWVIGDAANIGFINQRSTGNLIFAAGGLAASNEGARLTSTGDFGIAMVIPTARLHVKGVDATNTNFAAKIDNSASNPILTARNDQKVYIKATGGFAADVTLGIAGFTDTIGWRSTGYQRIRHGINDFQLGDARANIEWDTATASARFITGIKNDDTWGIFCANASDYGFEIDRTSRNIGLSMSTLSTSKLAIKGNTANSSESAVQLRNSLNATTFEFFNNGWFVASLPTSSAGLPSRALWDNGGVVNITP